MLHFLEIISYCLFIGTCIVFLFQKAVRFIYSIRSRSVERLRELTEEHFWTIKTKIEEAQAMIEETQRMINEDYNRKNKES